MINQTEREGMDVEDESNWKRRNGYGRWIKLKEKEWTWKMGLANRERKTYWTID